MNPVNHKALIYDLHFSLRNLINFIAQADHPVMWCGDRKIQVRSLPDYRLALDVYGRASSYLADVEAMDGAASIESVKPQAELKAEVQALREEIRSGLFGIAKNTQRTAQKLERWDGDGMPEI